MKNLLFLLLLSPYFTHAATYYVSPTGSDSNPGTITAPYATLQKATTVLAARPLHGAGDTIYVRNGSFTTWSNSSNIHIFIQNVTGTSGSPCIIMAYPGEHPVFDFSGVVRTAGTSGITTDPGAMYIKNCAYIHMKGLHITGLGQITSGAGASRGLEIENSPNCTFEQIEVDHIGGGAIHVYSGCPNTYFLNCDSHHNDDRYSGGGAGDCTNRTPAGDNPATAT